MTETNGEETSKAETSTEQEAGEFELIVSFTGLAVFARDGANTIVLHPDARLDKRRDGGRGMKHLDDTEAVPHVGYLSCDLKYLVPGVESGEVVVRFARDEVVFAVLQDEQTPGDLELPDFDQFAPVFELRRTLLDALPPEELLTRIRLRGGTLSTSTDGMSKTVTRTLPSKTNQGTKQAGCFADSVVWTRKLTGKSCDVTITNFVSGQSTLLPFKPVDGKIEVRVANVCGKNPLEWNDLWDSSEEYKKSPSDLDFKWLSVLFVTKKGEQKPHFGPNTVAEQVPFIFRTQQTDNQSLIENCIPGKATFPAPLTSGRASPNG